MLAGLVLRLLFFVYFPSVTDDSRIYAELATNWLQHGVYGQTQGAQIVPADTRLPGYPAFLALIFGLFGSGNYRAVMLTQALFDLGTCLIVADLTRRMVSDGAARIAFVMAALCPFLANYAAAVLTETLEIFFTALALDCAVTALDLNRESDHGLFNLWAAAGVAIAVGILLRPDGGILLAAIVLYVATAMRRPDMKGAFLRGRLVPGIVVVVFALAPLAPWTIRNFLTLHQLQPLAPRYANESNELVPRGFIRWIKTWIVDYASVEEIYWNVPGDKIDPEKLPSRAFDDGAEREATLAIIEDYNQSQQMTPQLDARFGEVAAARVRAHPARYYVQLPLLRAVDMWLRPRTEILPPDVRWWEFTDDARYAVMVVGFGLLNLSYVGAAVWALVRRPTEVRWAGLLVCFLLLRSALLLTLENPEPRYTLECYPAVIVLAASVVARREPGTAELRSARQTRSAVPT